MALFAGARLGPYEIAAPGLGLSAITTLEPATTPGMVMGTVPYMAPEQLEGKDADARTDLFAFGAVLYEMVTGRPEFPGQTSACVISAVMTSDPPPIASLLPVTPPALDRLVRRCVAKGPDVRCDSAHDVADELRWIRETGGDGGAPGAAAGVGARRGWTQRIALAIGVTLAAVAGAGLMWWLGPSSSSALTRPAVPVADAEQLNTGGADPALVETPGGSRTAFAWTPDGRALVLVGERNGKRQLYVRSLEAPAARPVPGTDGVGALAVSADGQSVAFWADGQIKKASLAGGSVVTMASGPDFAGAPWGLAWDDNGRLYFGQVAAGVIGRIDPGETIGPHDKPRLVTRLEPGEITHVHPCPLPGGRVLLYTVRRRLGTWGDDEVIALTLGTGTRTVLAKDAVDARYIPTGHLVFLRRGQLVAAPFDPERLTVGPEVPLLDQVAQALTAGDWADRTGAGQFAVSLKGTLAWVSASATPSLVTNNLVTVEKKDGRVTVLPAEAQKYYNPRLSPDGRRLAVQVSNITGSGLWLYDLERGGGLTPVVTQGENGSQVWYPKGERLAFFRLLNGRIGLASRSLDTAEVVEITSGAIFPTSVDADGRVLAVRDSGTQGTVRVTEDRGTARIESLMETESQERAAELSPDGRWLAYESKLRPTDSWENYQVFVRSYPEMGRPERVSFKNGHSPAWNPKKGPSGVLELFYSEVGQTPKHRMMAVDVTPGPPCASARLENSSSSVSTISWGSSAATLAATTCLPMASGSISSSRRRRPRSPSSRTST